ncbi:MAG: cyclic pyranopterin monophosphate synthase MoaC [Nitrospirae bacterium]|nr:cyclic pyranopterin monophosphate synthase MoaC [Nitrospirota bacterium]
MPLNYLDKSGRARMVDITKKPRTERTATATGRVYLRPDTLRRIQKGGVAKGDVLAIAQVAGVMAAKQVPSLIPLCHPLLLSGVGMHFKENPVPDSKNRCSITITAVVKTSGQTGVEMEAMTAVCVAALTIYDMCKAVDREVSFGEIRLVSKTGGKSGTYKHEVKGKK